MFCPNCGKETREEDNFCRFCGIDLRIKENIKEPQDLSDENNEQVCETKISSNDEELVLYDVKKHVMALVLPIFLTPLFFFYFWNIFLNTHSFFSWVIMISILGFIIYPIFRYKSDSIVITNKFVHIKIGVINPIEIAIPIQETEIFEVTQTSMGRILDYGTISFCYEAERFEYSYIKSPEDFQYIIDDPQRFVEESLED